MNFSKFFNSESIPNFESNRDSPDPPEMINSQTTKKASKGRCVLKLPLVEKFERGNSSFQALSIFYSLEKTLNSYPNLKSKCTDFMNVYLALRTIHQLCLDKIKNFPIAA